MAGDGPKTLDAAIARFEEARSLLDKTVREARAATKDLRAIAAEAERGVNAQVGRFAAALDALSRRYDAADSRLSAIETGILGEDSATAAWLERVDGHMIHCEAILERLTGVPLDEIDSSKPLP